VNNLDVNSSKFFKIILEIFLNLFKYISNVKLLINSKILLIEVFFRNFRFLYSNIPTIKLASIEMKVTPLTEFSLRTLIGRTWQLILTFLISI
jgi:hypothetical protein